MSSESRVLSLAIKLGGSDARAIYDHLILARNERLHHIFDLGAAVTLLRKQ